MVSSTTNTSQKETSVEGKGGGEERKAAPREVL